ncbi:unnamed protein product [Chrysoparadoxa australica]
MREDQPRRSESSSSSSTGAGGEKEEGRGEKSPRRGSEARRNTGGRKRGRDTGREESSSDSEDELPVASFKKTLMQEMRKHQVIVCTGETGSGKTTQIPQYAAELLRGKPAFKVAVTQPRRVAATTVARRVAEERGVRLGGEVGYLIRFDDHTSADTTIKYMTDGMLVRECLHDPGLSEYGIVMLDEAHERGINTDILFGMLKQALKKRSDLKAVITSATLDVEKFSAFFNSCPIVTVPGRTFPVDVYHSKTKQIMSESGPVNARYVEAAVETVLQIHTTQDEGHVLIFLTGQDEIKDCVSMLEHQVARLKLEERGKTDRSTPTMRVLPLYGALSGEAQAAAFRRVGRGIRKVIVATNIAETSVTVPGVRYVVDPGYVKQKVYNPERRMESLIVVPISQVAAQQRAGRAGRTAPGQCYRLYASECYGSMMKEMVPEIMRTSLSNAVLYLKVLGVADVLGFEFLDPPDPFQLEEALDLLYCLGAIDRVGAVTSLGKLMCAFPLEPCMSRALVESDEEGCMEEMLTIASLVSVENVWITVKESDEKFRMVKAKHDEFKHPLGDPITYLNLFKAWERSGWSDAWARESFLRIRALRMARSVRGQLSREADKAGLRSKARDKSAAGGLDAVRRAFCAGFFVNAAQRCAKQSVYRKIPCRGVYTGNPSDDSDTPAQLMFLHPSSAIGGKAGTLSPEFLCYIELISLGRGRPFMRTAMVVKHDWLQHWRKELAITSLSELCGKGPPPKVSS